MLGSNISLIALLVSASVPSTASDAPHTTGVEDERNDDVIVTAERARRPATATRLPLTLQETPQSVTVVDRQRIEDFNLFTIADVLEQTPGVTLTTTDSNRVNFNARGFPVRNFQFDGVPTIYQVAAYENSAVLDMAIYDRVEIVRGAAGLLTGVGDPSATINLVRKRAPAELRGSLAITAGSWSYYRIEGDVGGPLTVDGRVRARVAAAYTDAGSYVDFQHDRSPVVYGTIEADVTPTTRVRLAADYLKTNSEGSGWGSVPLFFNDGTRTDLPRSFSSAARWTYWRREVTTLFASVEQELGADWLARVSYNRRRGENNSALFAAPNGLPRPDGTGLPAPWNFYGDVIQREDAVDAYLSGRVALFGRDHEVVAGVNHFDRDHTVPRSAFGALPPGFPTTGFPNILTWDGRVPMAPIVRDDTPNFIEGTRQTGAYGVVRLNPADWLKVIGGVRYTDWRTGRDNFNPAGAPTTSTARAERRWAPYAGVVVDLVPTVSLYASYTSIFSPVAARGADNNVLDPTVGENYEAGVKATPFGEGVTLSLAGFHIAQDNVVQTDPNPATPLLPDGSRPSISVPGVKTWGAEAEVQGSPLPGWTLAGSYTYARTENAAGVLTNTWFPRHLGRVYTTYRLPGDRLTVGGGLTAQSRIFDTRGQLPSGRFNANGTPILVPGELGQGAYATVDLLARLQLTEAAVLGVNVTNLFDRTYFRNVGFGFGGPGGHYGEPRRIMGNIRVGF